MRESIIGDLEIRVGQARKEAAEALRHAMSGTFRGKDESVWLSEMDPVQVQNDGGYTRLVEKRDALELWEFLLTASRNWEPGDTAVELLETGTDDPGPGWNVHKSPYTDTGTSGQ
mgnify:CR=1 FL=1